MAAAQECLRSAETHLKEAETAAGAGAARDGEADWLARLAIVEAQCATTVAKAVREQARISTAPAGPKQEDLDKLSARARKAEEDQKRAEERAALLQRDLDLTEQEVIRTKAKLKGLETKAEASSAIAEARIMLRRLQEEQGRTPALARSQEKLDSAEQALGNDNYGAAAYLATSAQEILDQVRRGVVTFTDQDRAPPKSQYLVAAATANVRKEPNTTALVLGTLTRGSVVDATGLRGDWVKVNWRGGVGWIARSLLE